MGTLKWYIHSLPNCKQEVQGVEIPSPALSGRVAFIVISHRALPEPVPMRIRLLSALICIAILAAGASAQTKAPAPSAASTLIQMEHHWAEAVLKNDAATVEKMLADAFVQTGSNGRIKSRQQVLDGFLSGDRKLSRSDLLQVEVKLYQHETVAVVTGVWSGEGTFKGQPMNATERWTDTWIKTSAGWKCISSQSTEVK